MNITLPKDYRPGRGAPGARICLVLLPALASSARAAGPDVTICRLYDLMQYGRESDIVGLALATTSTNVGDENILWEANPSPYHPFIVSNLYRLHENRFEQIGQSWVKHGFFATNHEECGTECNDPGVGDLLGPGCTDTYSSGLNAYQGGLGPRYEINPWTGAFLFEGSHLDDHTEEHSPIDHRLQVHDADLDPALYPDATYVMEGYYVTSDDVDHTNSSSWKYVTPEGAPGETWEFIATDESEAPFSGSAIYAWTNVDRVTIQGIDDGRCILTYDVTEMGDGTWHYEFALYNLDMDRQVGSLSLPIPEGVLLTNLGFHDVDSHGEGYSNEDWTSEVAGGTLSWATDPYDANPLANPLRWGTLYNFRFDADTPPIARDVTLGLYQPGTPGTLTAVVVGPSTPGDCNENGADDADDIASGTSTDCNLNGLPDECDADCNMNDEADDCEIEAGTESDCNANGVPDGCELELNDCNADGIPDECQLVDNDCNGNAVPDDCDLLVEDCNMDGVVDSCDPEGAGPVILKQPESATVCIEDTHTFSIEAEGTGTLTAFWFKNGFLLPGEIELTLTLVDVDEDDVGNYSALIADSCGTAQSDSALLLVEDCSDGPTILYAASVAGHGSLGELDVPVSLINDQGPDQTHPTTDPRLGAGAHLRIIFDRPMDEAIAEDPSNIQITGETSGAVDPASILATLSSGIILDLTFPGLPDQKLDNQERYLVDLSLLEDTLGQRLSNIGDPDFELRLLAGDANGDAVVDPLDAGAVLARFGTDVSADPRYDINVDGAIDPLDAGAVLARLGHSAP